MKLQLNNAGSWKTIVDFRPQEEGHVRACATLLGIIDSYAAEANGQRCKLAFKLTDDADNPVAHWSRLTGWVERRQGICVTAEE